MSKRLNKIELKKDMIVGYLNVFFDWVVANKDKMIILTIAVIAILLAFISLGSQKKKINIKASNKLSLARQKVSDKKFEEAEKEYNELVNEYLHTYAGHQAVSYLMEYYYNKSKYDYCLDFINKILKKIKKDDSLYPKLLLTSAYCFEQKKEYEYAIKGFKDFTEKYQAHYMAPDAYLSLARCYNISGNIDAARTMGKVIIQKYSNTIWAQKAQWFADL